MTTRLMMVLGVMLMMGPLWAGPVIADPEPSTPCDITHIDAIEVAAECTNPAGPEYCIEEHLIKAVNPVELAICVVHQGRYACITFTAHPEWLWEPLELAANAVSVSAGPTNTLSVASGNPGIRDPKLPLLMFDASEPAPMGLWVVTFGDRPSIPCSYS